MLTDATQNAIYEKLGELIREARISANIKQELLADYIDLTRVSISNIEKGKQKIQLHTLLELAKYLRISLPDLLEPLNALIVDTVTSKQEKRIMKGLQFPKASKMKSVEDADKVKEFVNFLKSKNT